jgi:uncharacterized protein YceK
MRLRTGRPRLSASQSGTSAQRAATTALLIAALCGCATAGTLAEHETKNKVFSGTIRHVELKCAHGVCLDFPFSLVADTVLLPVTIPWSIANWARAEPDGSASETRQRREGRE